MGLIGMGGAVFKRRRYVVDRRAQTRIAVWIVLHVAACLALVLLLALLPTLLRLAQGRADELAGSREHLFLEAPLTAVVAVLLVVVTINSFVLTNRIFGPLARLRLVLRRWRAERVWPQAVGVRRHDFHAGLFEDVSEVLAEVGKDVEAARDQLRAVDGMAQDLEARLGLAEEGERVRAIAAACSRAREHLERWHR